VGLAGWLVPLEVEVRQTLYANYANEGLINAN
jgi:hypothetical protein